MKHVILINGSGGAGKETTARLLLTHLTPCAWIDSKALINVTPWSYGEALIELGVRNSAALTNNFLHAGYPSIVVSGGIGHQRALDLFCALTKPTAQVDYVWLHASKAIRDRRRITRARDAADQAEYLDEVDAAMPDPGPLMVPSGSYHRINSADRSVAEVVHDMLAVLNLTGGANR